jgi:hypothetical protein
MVIAIITPRSTDASAPDSLSSNNSEFSLTAIRSPFN